MQLTDATLSEALTAIHDGRLTRDEADAIVDVARFAASVDGRMDLAEMSTVARMSRILYALAGEPNPPVPSAPMAASSLRELGNRLVSTGPRELAYAVVRLISIVDDTVAPNEGELAATLTAALRLTAARAHELDIQLTRSVRGET